MREVPMEPLSRRRFLALSAGAALSAAAASCTPGTPTKVPSAPPQPVETGVTGGEPVTLTVWDQEQDRTVSAVWDQLNKEFEKKYPTVTIDRVSRGFGDLKALLKLALTGPHGPDVVEANQGWPDMGEMVKAGLLLPMDNYAAAYGWNDRVSENANATSSWTPDGKQFGTGSLYGFTTMGELVGVYYNKTILTKLGLELPTTFAEFEQALAAAKQGGEIPIQFGDLDPFAGAHVWAAVQERFVAESYMTDFIFGLRYADISFDNPGNLKAATVLQDWARKGYFSPDFLAVGYDDSVTYFSRGRGLFMITGNWVVSILGADSSEFGFAPMPPRDAGGTAVSTGGPGFPLAIAASSKNPDAAAAYIDWMTNDHASQLLVPTGQIPLSVGFSPSSVATGTLLSEVLDSAGKLTAANGIVPYEDWATPGFYSTLTSAIQELMGDRITPQQFLTKVQEEYATFQESRPAPTSPQVASSASQPSPAG
jgi:raffinose/stachyose/melibiose transport system substrate-binding protein